MTTTADNDVYVDIKHPDELFVDPAFQRDLDETRAQRIANTWNRRLLGIIEVSDRGPDAAPRYAVIDGQHRWAAARLLTDPPPLVVNVHEGLTVAQEAELFDKLNRWRKQTNTWDHWRARRVAGDQAVLDIERVATRNGLTVHMSPADGTIACVSVLEKIVKLGGLDLLNDTLSLITEIWGPRRDALEASIVHGLALVLWYLEHALSLQRLGDALLDVLPRQLKSNATALADMTNGSAAIRTAIAIVTLYNKTPGRRILVSERTFRGPRREPKGGAK